LWKNTSRAVAGNNASLRCSLTNWNLTKRCKCMKKLIALVLVLLFVLALASCSNEKDKVVTYSFSGNNDYFAITRGSITPRSDGHEEFDGGYLEIIQEDLFSATISCSMTYFVLTNGEREIILTQGMKAAENKPININGKLGRISFGNPIFDKANPDKSEQVLWFELKTTDINGNQEVYELQLGLTPIHD